MLLDPGEKSKKILVGVRGGLSLDGWEGTVEASGATGGRKAFALD